jgi:hypothetical protein
MPEKYDIAQHFEKAAAPYGKNTGPIHEEVCSKGN